MKKLREDELTDTGLTKEQQRLVNAYAAANIRHFMQQNADNAINVAEASVAWERNFLTENPELRAKINAMVENGELGKEHTVVGIVREIDESELAEEMKRETPSVEVEPEDGQEVSFSSSTLVSSDNLIGAAISASENFSAGRLSCGSTLSLCLVSFV